MRLIRNTTATGTCKYAIIRMDKLCENHIGFFRKLLYWATQWESQEDKKEFDVSIPISCIELGRKYDSEEFFVIKLKDHHAHAALLAYAKSAEGHGDLELAHDIRELADRSLHHPKRHFPDNLESTNGL